MSDIETQVLSQNQLDEKPWKYVGYKEFARFMASDDDYFALRRFDRFHTRILLTLQDRVSQLEEELDDLDCRLSQREASDVDNGSCRNDQVERVELIERSLVRITQYDDMLDRYTKLKSLQNAPSSNSTKIKTWLFNRREPIDQQEVKFVNTGDLLTVAKTQKSPLRRLFEHRVLSPTRGFYGLFTKTPEMKKSSTTTVYGDDSQVDILATLAILITAVVMLIAPMWILASIDSQSKKLGVITGFLAVFTPVLSWGTLARPFEVLAATAGWDS